MIATSELGRSIDDLPSEPVPNLPSLRYENVWFTGLFGGAQPARSTAPIGGVIQ